MVSGRGIGGYFPRLYGGASSRLRKVTYLSCFFGRPESIAGPPYDRDKLNSKVYTLFGKIEVAGRIKCHPHLGGSKYGRPDQNKRLAVVVRAAPRVF